MFFSLKVKALCENRVRKRTVLAYDLHQGIKEKKGLPNMETTHVVCTHVCVFYLPVSACPLCSK